jgi:hypothetical protein
MAEQVGGTPQQLDAGGVLALLGQCHQVLQVVLVLADVIGIRSQIDIVEAPVRGAELGEELERGIELGFGDGQRRASLFPRETAGARTERVGAGIAEGMPVGGGKAQMLGHGLVADFLVGVIDLER